MLNGIVLEKVKAKAVPGYIGVRNRNQEPPAEGGPDVSLNTPRKGERAGKPARHACIYFNLSHTCWEGKYEPRA
jgi:hypothetical protein